MSLRLSFSLSFSCLPLSWLSAQWGQKGLQTVFLSQFMITVKVDRLPKGPQRRLPASLQGRAWVMGLVPRLGSAPLSHTACCSYRQRGSLRKEGWGAGQNENHVHFQWLS